MKIINDDDMIILEKREPGLFVVHEHTHTEREREEESGSDEVEEYFDDKKKAKPVSTQCRRH